MSSVTDFIMIMIKLRFHNLLRTWITLDVSNILFSLINTSSADGYDSIINSFFTSCWNCIRQFLYFLIVYILKLSLQQGQFNFHSEIGNLFPFPLPQRDDSAIRRGSHHREESTFCHLSLSKNYFLNLSLKY